jgi:hypothetical protein
MRVLLVIAAAAASVALLVWPREETPGHACRAPASGGRTARSAEHPEADGTVTAVNLGGTTPGVERGHCTLRLRLLDQVTGEAFASNVDLWRLELPEDESWTAGDQRQATDWVAGDGGTFANLPAGLYRIAAHGQSYLAEDDPPAFLVRGAVTDLGLSVRAPRSHRVFLRVFNEGGRELRNGTLRHHRGIHSSTTGEPDDPAWARPRQPKRAAASLNGPIGVRGNTSGCGDGRGTTGWTNAGFDLGRFREDSRSYRSTSRLSLLVPGHSGVMVKVDGRLSGERTCVAVAVSMREIKDLVFLPDGRRAADAGALFEASSRAVAESPLHPDAWRSLPVNVRVALAGYEMLKFEYRVDRPPAPPVMRSRFLG